MNRRNLLNLALLVIVAALAAVALWEPGKTPPPEPERLTRLDPADVTRVRIERAGQPTVAAERVDGRWQLSEPFSAAANGYRFDALLQVARTSTQGRFPAPQALEGYGLAEPPVRLTLNEAVTLAFGTTTPVDQRRYVLHEDAVHLVDDTFYYHLIGGVGTFVDPKLLPDGASPIAIELPELALHNRDGHWRISPEPPEISADAVAELVSNWQRARAIEVKRWTGGELRGDAIRIRLAGDGEALSFVAVTDGEGVALVRPELGLAWHLPEAVSAGLFALPPPPEAAPDSAG